MRILFYYTPTYGVRHAQLTFDSLNGEGGSGFSGTETTMMEFSRYLTTVVKTQVMIMGHSVENRYVTDGVAFEPFNTETAVAFNPDWYCPMFFLSDGQHGRLLQALQPNSATCKVLVWMQCFVNQRQLDHIKNMGFQLAAIYPSAFVAKDYSIPHSAIVHNGVRCDIYDINEHRRVRGRWIFHACRERGSAIANQVFNRVRSVRPEAATDITHASYHKPDGRASLSKHGVADLLAQSEWFVYPLVLPNGQVHHDTFGCCVMEALAMGVIVVTWDVACMKDVYGDAIVRVPVLPSGGYDPSSAFGSNRRLCSEQAVACLADAVLRVDSDPVEKARLKRAGRELALQHDWDVLGPQVQVLLSASDPNAAQSIGYI